MKYMLLMTATAAGWASTMEGLNPTEMQAHIGFMRDIGAQLEAAGELLDAQGLTPPEQARIVRASPSGGPLITDGPFPETKEFLAGYWLVDVASPERACELAATISAAPGKGGAPLNFPLEVRAVG